MIVRPATPQDLPQVIELEKRCFTHGAWHASQWTYEIEENDVAHLLIAEQDNLLLGYLDFWILFEQATINKVAVLPELRRKKIGWTLLQDALSRMKEGGILSVTLEVRVSNLPAITLYKAMGFQIVLTKKAYYSDGEDAYFMIKEGWDAYE